MNTNKRKTLLATFVALFAAGATTQGAMAQTESATEQWLLEEVVVTATKRETSLQDTAMSISVLSGEDMEDRGVLSLTDIIATVPGVDLGTSQPGFPVYIVRGVASANNFGAFGSEITSTYLDEFPMPSLASDVSLVDVARVEVLKGPQGTLYGKSAMGGVFRYITNEPTTEGYSGVVNVYGSSTSSSGDNNYGGSGYINVPITDNLAARVVAYNFDNAGFIDADGVDKAEDVNTTETKGGRIALKWDISESTHMGLTYLNQTVRTGANQLISSTYTPDPLATVCPCPAPADFSVPSTSVLTRQYAGEGYDFDTEMLNLKLDKEFEGFNLSVMASQQEQTLFRREITNNFVRVTSPSRFSANSERVWEADTVEVRLVSDSEGDAFIDWIAGFWYEDRELSHRTLTSHTGATVTVFGLNFVEGDKIEDFLLLDLSSEKAIYGEVALHASDKATFTLGYRRSNVKRDAGSFEFARGEFDVFGKLPLVGLTGTEIDEDVNTYKAKYEYVFNDDILLYTSASSGYRAGGFNANSLVALASTYESDTLWNYELGVKTAWLENRLTANGAIYRIDWDDMQLVALDQTTFVRGVRNVGKARIQGLELEFNYLVRDDLSLGLNYAFTDATLEEDFVPDVRSGLPTALAGERLPGSSRNNYALFVDWQWPLTSELNTAFRVTHRYIGDRVDDLGDDSRDQPLIPSYSLTDLRVSVEHSNGLTVSVFADNVSNKIAITEIREQGTYFTNYRITRPRTVGLNVGYRF